MQDIEFTIQDGKLWMLQCRNGKRTGAAMVKIAMDMLRERSDRRTHRRAALRAGQTRRAAHPVFDKKAIANAQVITKGLPASPGAATGPVVILRRGTLRRKSSDRVGPESDPLVRIETSPEDLQGHA